MRDRLIPVLVATAVLAETETSSGPDASILAACLARAHEAARKGDRKEKAILQATFPCLAV